MDGNSLMPFGKHKGKKMINVPSDYLIWLYGDQELFGVPSDYLIWLYGEQELFGDLLEYIEENMDALKLEGG